MKVYLDNDGTYGDDIVNIPFIVNDMPIGFVSEVNKERITCHLWDKYIKIVKHLNRNTLNSEISSIYIQTKEA